MICWEDRHTPLWTSLRTCHKTPRLLWPSFFPEYLHWPEDWPYASLVSFWGVPTGRYWAGPRGLGSAFIHPPSLPSSPSCSIPQGQQETMNCHLTESKMLKTWRQPWWKQTENETKQNKITMHAYTGRKLNTPIQPLTQSFSALHTPCPKVVIALNISSDGNL